MVDTRPSLSAITQPRAVRWADIGASDSEGEDVLPAVPFSIDDSYREAPVPSLEDSRSGLNRRLAGCSAGLGEERPQDFTFLLERPRATSEETRASTTESPAWRPNVHAPEFIPTLSMSCPLVGLIAGSPNMEALECRGPSEAAVAPFTTPEKSRAPSPGPSGERRRRRGGKRRSLLQEPLQKRSRSAENENSGSQAVVQGEQVHHDALPEATEEDWQRRGEVRRKAVETIKQFPEYQWYAAATPREEREAGAPTTPDPQDRTISKRKWKFLTTTWRSSLKQRYTEEGHGSVVPTEDPEGTALHESDES